MHTSMSMLLLLVAAQTQNAMSWVTNLPTQKMSLLGGGRISSSHVIVSAGPFFEPEEDFECPDEEGCEIDWDNMPGFDDEEEEEPVLDETSFAAQAVASMERSRVQLEMRWQIDECETDVDTCEDFCEDCAGSGKQYCRFCRGTPPDRGRACAGQDRAGDGVKPTGPGGLAMDPAL